MPQDIRLAFRLFRRTPLATGVALLSIALSVGATAMVFTAVKAVLIEPIRSQECSHSYVAFGGGDWAPG